METRVLAATHRDLDAEAEAGTFRRDLFYRLNVHVIRVPALRERGADVGLLADHFAATLAARLGRSVRPVSDAARDALRARDWRRNNVRELRNTIERMIIASDGPRLDVDHIPPDLGPGGAPGGEAEPVSSDLPIGGQGTFREQKREAEQVIVRRALEAHDWKVGRTAEALGLADHSSLLKIMKRLGVRRPERPGT